ncbi:MAG TPA: hypothetical protein VFI52_01070 [Gemmatimonadaceae bacterium]|nr:hypothetical protein [Gemmatimonadaceae bacterium]
MRIRLLSLLGTVALIGCGSTGPDRPDGTPPFQSFTYPAGVIPTGYQASMAGQPGVTVAGVRLTNAGNASATIEHGACSVAVWLYRDDQPNSPPVWQNRLPEGAFCIDIAYMTILLPGQSYEVAGAQLGAATLGATLPAGRYLVRVAITRRSPEQLIVLDAGTFALDL